MHVRTAVLLAALLTLFAPGVAPAAEPDLEREFAERILREAKVALDGESLLKLFRARTPSEARRAELAAHVRRLGDDAFPVREKATQELIRAGRAALPFVRPALRDPDLEVRRRARRCLQVIDAGNEVALLTAAARVLADRKPAGAAEVLLAYLPAADDETLEGEIHRALAAAARPGGKADPALVRALADREPTRRAAAAYALGRGAPEQRRAVRRLLADADARVRWQAARALVPAGEKEAVGVLIALLEDGTGPLAWRAQDALGRIAGEQAPPVMPGEEGRKLRAGWEAWWKANAPRIDLTKVDLEGGLLGLTVIGECDLPGQTGGRIWECGRDGKQRWEIKGITNPTDVQVLPGGRILVAEYQSSRATERDRQGKVLWAHTLKSMGTTARRLPNGNTFLANYNEILEITPRGKVVYSYHSNAWGSIYRAQKLRNNHILFVCSNRNVVELDERGKEVRSVRVPGNPGPWAGVELLPNGHYLVALYSGNKVVEIDARGKVLWECSVQTPSAASRLPNGRVLVSSMDARKVIEFDRGGKAVWQQATVGRPFFVGRR